VCSTCRGSLPMHANPVSKLSKCTRECITDEGGGGWRSQRKRVRRGDKLWIELWKLLRDHIDVCEIVAAMILILPYRHLMSHENLVSSAVWRLSVMLYVYSKLHPGGNNYRRFTRDIWVMVLYASLAIVKNLCIYSTLILGSAYSRKF